MNNLMMADDNTDDHVDTEIISCLNLDNPKSFFLFAGAGSGKTRSLVNALDRLCKENNRNLRISGRKIGVITYTNPACDQIKQRLGFNPLVEVLTIHSFIWLMISGFNRDIKAWMKIDLENDIAVLKDQEQRGRAGTKASNDRLKSIDDKIKRLATLDTIKEFTYNPNGNNSGRASLNHSDVIKIGASFLEKPLMQDLLVSQYPVLLIDESQDTNKGLMEALLKLQSLHKQKFALGLLGDTMQRIYSDGKNDLGQNLPTDWATPVKIMNHRCPKRIVSLINKIRLDIDGQQQRSRSDKEDGFANLFIVNSRTVDKAKAEHLIAKKMAIITNDILWTELNTEVKMLILEHHMAAKRMGFFEMFEALYKADTLRTGLLDGSVPGIRFFSTLILPIVKAKKNDGDFKIASIVRKNSPLLSEMNLINAGVDQTGQLKKAHEAVNKLLALWSNDNNPQFLDVLLCVAQTNLFEIPESLRPIVARNNVEQLVAKEEITNFLKKDEENIDSVTDIWDIFLQTPFSQIEPYVDYVSGQANFDTHQGVKGLEFPRVMVIIDDLEARGFLFSYEKLFGVRERTQTDINNEREGNDNSNYRTRRLFYVTCSRAEKSLAIVAYSENPEKVRDNLIAQDWFKDSEIEILK